MTPDSKIILYGTSWCSDCFRSRRYLDTHNIEYIEVDIEQDESGLQKVIELNNGNRSVPTIVFPDGSHLVEPSNQALAEKLGL